MRPSFVARICRRFKCTQAPIAPRHVPVGMACRKCATALAQRRASFAQTVQRLLRCPSTTRSLRLPSSPPRSPNSRLSSSTTMRRSATVRSRCGCIPYGHGRRKDTWHRPTFETGLRAPSGCFPPVSRADSAEPTHTLLQAKPCAKVCVRETEACAIVVAFAG